MPCSMAAETSDVNAPCASQWASCAPTPISVPLSASATAVSARNVGQTTRSTVVYAASRWANSCAKAAASCTVLYIFQLPAMIGVRRMIILVVFISVDQAATKSTSLFILQGHHTGQGLAFEHFQTCATTRRNMCDLFGKAGTFHCGGRVAATDDGNCPITCRFGQQFCNCVCSVGKSRDFKHAHRPIPDNRFSAAEMLFEQFNGARANIVNRPTVGCAAGNI